MTPLFAIAGGASVGNLYWAQPLLAPIAEDFGVSPGNAGLVITLTQIGYALGVFLIVPLGDSMDRKRIIPAVMLLAAVALAATALAPSFPVLLGLVALLGVASVTGQILAPLAGDLATSEQRGRVLGTVASGLMLSASSSPVGQWPGPLETVARTALSNLSGQRHPLMDDTLPSRTLRCPFFCPAYGSDTKIRPVFIHRGGLSVD